MAKPTTQELLEYAKQQNATRLKVEDKSKKGKYSWMPIADVQPHHKIITQTDDPSKPVFQKGIIGRPPMALNAVEPVDSVAKELTKRRAHQIRTDEILSELAERPDNMPGMIRNIIKGIGEEAASLKFDRLEAERLGHATVGISAKRVLALRAMAETGIKMAETFVQNEIDLDSKPFKAVFKLIFETIREAMFAIGYGDQEVDTILSKISTLVNEDWYKEARTRMKQQ